jgi:WhiB family redox-sensing transcriptional regulator
VQLACREHALAVREPYGVWGGLSEHEREELTGAGLGAAAAR